MTVRPWASPLPPADVAGQAKHLGDRLLAHWRCGGHAFPECCTKQLPAPMFASFNQSLHCLHICTYIYMYI